jgi:putative transposase
MTAYGALRLTQPDPATSPAGAVERQEAHGTRWLWLDDAARILGRNEGTLRRKAAEVWFPRQLARMAERANGQKAWQVSELADPALAERAAPVPAPAERPKLTDAQEAAVNRKARLLQGWWEAVKAGASIGLTERQVTARYVETARRNGDRVSRERLFEWQGLWRRRGGALGLLDGRWKAADDAAAPPDEQAATFEETLKRLWLSERRRSIRQCLTAACEAAGLEETDALYKRAQRVLKAIPRATAVLLRDGDTAFTNLVEPYIERDYTLIDANQLWCSDHHRFNVQVEMVDPRTGEVYHDRPWLHAWQDMRSRRIMGYCVFAGDPNAALIARTFCGAVDRFGCPAKVYLDNGKDFDSRVFTGMSKLERRRLAADRRAGRKPSLDDAQRVALGGTLSMLDVQVKHAWKDHGQSKPIERWFKTVDIQFSKRFETYTGRDTADKPEDLGRMLLAGKAPTLAAFAEAFDGYVAEFNASPHTGDGVDGQTPDAAWAVNLRARRTIPSETLEWARLTRVTVTVRRKGVVQLPGLDVRYGRGERALVDRIGQKVVVAYDPDDLNRAFACDASDGRPLARIEPVLRLSPDADQAELKDKVREKRQLKRLAKAYAAARPKMGLDAVELHRRAAAKKVSAERERQVMTGTDPLAVAADAPISLAPSPLAGHATQIRQVLGRASTMALRPEGDGGDDGDAPDRHEHDPLPIDDFIRSAAGRDDEAADDQLDDVDLLGLINAPPESDDEFREDGGR